MDTELPFALEHHIPVLPVAFEPVLAGPFAEKFRDMEFLNRAKHDETAIPYEEKLKKYIQSILVGGELAGQLGTPEAWEKLSLICSRLGDLCRPEWSRS